MEVGRSADVSTEAATVEAPMSDADFFNQGFAQESTLEGNGGETSDQEEAAKTAEFISPLAERQKTIDTLVEYYGGQLFQYKQYGGDISLMLALCPAIKNMLDTSSPEKIMAWLDDYKVDELTLDDTTDDDDKNKETEKEGKPEDDENRSAKDSKDKKENTELKNEVKKPEKKEQKKEEKKPAPKPDIVEPQAIIKVERRELPKKDSPKKSEKHEAKKQSLESSKPSKEKNEVKNEAVKTEKLKEKPHAHGEKDKINDTTAELLKVEPAEADKSTLKAVEKSDNHEKLDLSEKSEAHQQQELELQEKKPEARKEGPKPSPQLTSRQAHLEPEGEPLFIERQPAQKAKNLEEEKQEETLFEHVIREETTVEIQDEPAPQEVELETIFATIADGFQQAIPVEHSDAGEAETTVELAEAITAVEATAPHEELKNSNEAELQALLSAVSSARESVDRLYKAKTKQECAECIDQLTIELAVILRSLGYENPEVIVHNYIYSHPVDSLKYLIEQLERVLRSQLRQESSVQPASQGAQYRHQRLGKVASYIMKLLSPYEHVEVIR